MRLTVTLLNILRTLLKAPDSPQYGFELSAITGILPGSLYPNLKRLEHEGWVSATWEDIDPRLAGRSARRYYRLTKIGKEQAMKTVSQFGIQPSAPLPNPPLRFNDAFVTNTKGLVSAMSLSIGGKISPKVKTLYLEAFELLVAVEKHVYDKYPGLWIAYDVDEDLLTQSLDLLLEHQVPFDFKYWDDGLGFRYQYRPEIGIECHKTWGPTADEVVYPQWDIDRLRDFANLGDLEGLRDYLNTMNRWKQFRLPPLEFLQASTN
jgi:PadR family transcriptional regulator, regulatory protein PadR